MPYGDYETCDYCSAPRVVDLVAERDDGTIEEAQLCERHYEHLQCYLGSVRWVAENEVKEIVWKVA